MTQVYRDRSGRRLEDYPRPSVAVDVALLTVLPADEPTLGVLQVRGERRGWALPGTFLHPGERLVDAALRCLTDKAGVSGMHPRQLHVFDDPDRDDRGWVLSAAHVDACPVDRLADRTPDSTRLVPVSSAGRLPFGHGSIIELAVDDLRRRYARDPDPAGLLGRPFTLRELRVVHQAVAGRDLQRDTFRRSVEDGLVPTGSMSEGLRGRPAELFTRR